MATSILIVDDEYGLADIMVDLLGEAGHDVALAINGKLGLDSLKSRRADLVIVDLMMPVMDGPDMVRAMRAHPELKHIPVILMTALPEGIPKDPELTFDAILVKPFSMVELNDAIARVLTRS